MDERKRRTSLSLRWLIGLSAVALVIAGVRFALWFPTEARIRGCLTTSMFEVELCPGSKNYVPLKHISRNVQHAVVTSEDGRFWSHEGFDWEEVQSSFEKNLEEGRYKRGGSTITQQLAKNMFLSAEKTVTRKLLEVLITVRIEQVLSKKEILERYLNVVQFGEGIYGIKAAAWHYFKKGPAQLGPAEAAFLAMLLPNPLKYSRSFRQKQLTTFARKRMTQILRQMHRAGRLSAGAYQEGLYELSFFFGSRPEKVDPAPAAEGIAPVDSANDGSAPTDGTSQSQPVPLGPALEPTDSEVIEDEVDE